MRRLLAAAVVPAVGAIALAVLSSPQASAQDEFPRLKFGAVLDLRAIRTDRTQSWLDVGLGKTRFGGAEGEHATLFRLATGSLLLDASASELLSASLQVNVDAQPDNRSERRPVDLVTAVIAFRPELTPRLRLRLRGGIMFPPISLENTGPAWIATRTLTPSAANSWIGEEVRTTGVEAELVWKGEFDDLSVMASAFGGNDAAGTLLAWRGFALHDRTSGFSDQLPIPPLPAIAADAFQAQRSQPFTEIDGRLGYYVCAQWKRRGIAQVNAIVWDNRGNEDGFDGFQWAWKTSFANVGALVQLPRRVELLGQHMWGRTSELRFGQPVPAVDAPFRATYGMASVPVGRHRFSVRYDRFAVDHDGTLTLDSTRERGHAWTGAWLLTVAGQHQVALEVLRLDSDRPDREVLKLPTHARELQAQASFQFRF
jgi:hypothetical protein